MKLTAHRCVLFAALCSTLLLAVATAASIGASSAAAKAGGATAGSAAPLNPAHLQSMVSPLFGAVSAADGHGLGLRPGPQDFSYAQGMRVPLASAARERVALPATYDLRSLGRVTSVKNQGAFGTCWAFASCGSLESGLLPGEIAGLLRGQHGPHQRLRHLVRRRLRLMAATSGCPPPTWSAGAAPSTRATMPMAMASRRPA